MVSDFISRRDKAIARAKAKVSSKTSYQLGGQENVPVYSERHRKVGCGSFYGINECVFKSPGSGRAGTGVIMMLQYHSLSRLQGGIRFFCLGYCTLLSMVLINLLDNSTMLRSGL